MIVGNPLYPLPASYSSIDKLNQQFNTLQAQLATGNKAQTLADLGSVRYTDLTVRARLGRMTGYDNNISTVNMRLDMMNQMLSSVSSINAATRGSSVPASYGTNYLNFATAATNANSQLGQVLTTLDTDLNGHYLFGGSEVDQPPVASPDAVMNGADGKDGFKTVASQRLQADQGVNSMGRLSFVSVPSVSNSAGTVTLTDAGAPGATLQSVTASNPTAITIAGAAATSGPPPTTGQFTVAFDSANLPQAGDTVTINTQLPDGSTQAVTLRAVTATDTTNSSGDPDVLPGEFLVGADATSTAANFQTALNRSTSASVTLSDDTSPFGMKLLTVTSSNTAAISTSGSAGSSGPPAVAGQFSIGFNYDSSTVPPTVPKAGDTVSVQVAMPDGTTDTMTLTAVAATDTTVNGVPSVLPGEFLLGSDAASTGANFKAALTSSIQNETQSTLTVASNFAAANDFFYSAGGAPQRIDGGGPPADYATATGYESSTQALADTVQWYTGDNQSQADARSTVTTKVDDHTSVNYGVQGNEYGFTQLIRSLAVQSIASYSTDETTDPSLGTSPLDLSKTKYDAIAERVQTNLSTIQDSKQGSLAAIGVDLGLSQTTLQNLSDQHTSYGAQLQDVLTNSESADPNEVASALLELQTRLSASYTAVSMISQLQLANYLS
ncbi:MAG TPA: hypothetical protein VHB74_04970 [Devosia sp.]|nr:hypothetical protein [Devosia sp.]